MTKSFFTFLEDDFKFFITFYIITFNYLFHFFIFFLDIIRGSWVKGGRVVDYRMGPAGEGGEAQAVHRPGH